MTLRRAMARMLGIAAALSVPPVSDNSPSPGLPSNQMQTIYQLSPRHCPQGQGRNAKQRRAQRQRRHKNRIRSYQR